MKLSIPSVARFTLALMAALLLTACGPLGAAAPTAAPQPTVAPPTSAPVAAPTEAPPTAAPSPIPPTETALPTPDAAATAAAEATAEVAPALAGIDSDLQEYGFSTEVGHLGWMHDPVTLELEDYLENQVSVEKADLSVHDFVVQADITWNSSSGLAGCGFVVRRDALPGNDYRLLVIRASGEPSWFFWRFENGEWSNSLAGWREAPSLSIEQGSTNTVALVGEGIKFTLYVNGNDMGTVADTQLEEGAVGFAASHESGKTTCTFENGWLWILED